MKYYQNPNGKVYAYDETDPTQTSLIAAAVTAGWADITASWPPAPPPIPLSVQAQTQLDIVTGPRGQIIRCVAAGVAVTSAWTTYVAALRAIANGTDTTSTVLPTQPAYITGT